MPFCTNCGNQVPEGTKFCPSCGTPIIAKETEPAVEPELEAAVTPEPVAEPIAEPEPTPAPEPVPEPIAEPEPTPAPTGNTTPQIDLSQEFDMESGEEPEPIVGTYKIPGISAPWPQMPGTPAPQPAPAPQPGPVPVPIQQPPVQNVAPAPAPQRAPGAQPVPAPAPMPQPIPAPAPQPAPAPMPQPIPAPAPQPAPGPAPQPGGPYPQQPGGPYPQQPGGPYPQQPGGPYMQPPKQKSKALPIILAIVGGILLIAIIAIVAIKLIGGRDTGAQNTVGNTLTTLIDEAAYNRMYLDDSAPTSQSGKPSRGDDKESAETGDSGKGGASSASGGTAAGSIDPDALAAQYDGGTEQTVDNKYVTIDISDKGWWGSDLDFGDNGGIWYQSGNIDCQLSVKVFPGSGDSADDIKSKIESDKATANGVDAIPMTIGGVKFEGWDGTRTGLSDETIRQICYVGVIDGSRVEVLVEDGTPDSEGVNRPEVWWMVQSIKVK